MARSFAFAAFVCTAIIFFSSAHSAAQSSPAPSATPSLCDGSQTAASSEEIVQAARTYRSVLESGIAAFAPPDYQGELALYQAELACARRGHDADSRIAGLYEGLGIVEEHLGLYAQAVEAEGTARVIFHRRGDRSSEAYDDNDLGDAETALGEYDDALQSYEKSLALFTELGDRGAMALVHIDRATAEERQGDYAVALTDAQQAQATLGGSSERMLAAIALIERDLHRYNDARRLYGAAVRADAESGNSIEESQALAGVAAMDLRLDDYASALMIARHAVQLDATLRTPTWQGLATAAAAEAGLDHTADALRDYDAALRNIEGLRASASGTTRAAFFATALYVYDSYIEYLLALDRRFPGKGYDRKALEIFERRQGRAFLEQVAQSAASQFAGVPKETSDRERELSDNIADYQSSVAQAEVAGNPAAALSWKVSLAAATAERGQLERAIQTQYPAYYALENPQPLQERCSDVGCTTFAKFQSRVLRRNEAVLLYDIFEPRSALWVITPRSLRLYYIADDYVLRAQIARFEPGACGGSILPYLREGALRRIIRQDATPCAVAAHLLYASLIPSAAEKAIASATTLFIVPSGPLFGVPFEALVTQSPATGHATHYLVEEKSIAYLSSASLLNVLRQGLERRRRLASQSLLAFANPDYAEPTPAPCGSTTSLMSTAEDTSEMGELRTRALQRSADGAAAFDPLPGSQAEAIASFAALGVSPTDASLYLCDRATKANVVRLNDDKVLAAYRYIVFGTHAVLQAAQAGGITQSEIVLARPRALNDYLTMADVLGLSLHAEAVILSACNSGGGGGVGGLTQAFMFAGTPIVGVTYWSVADKIQEKLTPAFFRALDDGYPAAPALREAKLALIRSDDPLENAPYFWAPMVIFGDGDVR
ncbi:MAG TPA: CHAT domain-containing tetratricopeptide repeat protein [Candidatus Cybelea sp.]|jgi:CHAT domain-containing protein/tetratricopeptide (TPR) repeat protein|nr:CHAT domain-containing tetratricopeptide repeat protein [Candidatus Cybelea sp.]